MSAFERLGFPKKLAFEEAQLDEKFRELSKDKHPDLGGDEKAFQEIRRAYEELKSPLSRLKSALAEVDTRGAISNELMDLFGPVAELIQKVNDFSTERSKAKSDLGKAVLDAQIPLLKAGLEEKLSSLDEIEEDLESNFVHFDECGWEECQAEMAEVFRGLTFIVKWKGQLRASLGKLFETLL